ncbi:hypothetical protein RhiJN_23040 [Ceratobasidium sp. AG-Ba]|nr:hypothetical protein RhiJN_23040 [Ceratobasidium sp. AG-Ba]
MPAADPADQQAARVIESTLRDAVQRSERPPIELVWFLALPKRIRRSGRLLEAAQAEAKVLVDRLRADWDRERQCEQEREARLTKAKAMPRDLECLRAPDPKAWNGLGRRKTRCRKFEGIGRLYTARQRAATSILPPQPVESLESESHLPPTRPPTPPGLRIAIYNTPELLSSVMTEENYGTNSPAPVAAPDPSSTHVVPPVLPALAVDVPRPAYPYTLAPRELTVLGKDVDKDATYIIARGRHAWSPMADRTLRDVAIDVVCAQSLAPGALEYLADLLFPLGVSQYEQALPAAGLEILVEFVRGWYEICMDGF